MPRILLPLIFILLSLAGRAQESASTTAFNAIHKDVKYLYLEYYPYNNTVQPDTFSFDSTVISKPPGAEAISVTSYLKGQTWCHNVPGGARLKMRAADSLPNLEEDSLSLFYPGTSPASAVKMPTGYPKYASYFYSTLEAVSAAGKRHILYRFQEYNCYDPQCGQKHNHIAGKEGLLYFDPQQGILLEHRGRAGIYILLQSDGKMVPAALVLQLLRRSGANAKEMRAYRHYIKAPGNGRIQGNTVFLPESHS